MLNRPVCMVSLAFCFGIFTIHILKITNWLFLFIMAIVGLLLLLLWHYYKGINARKRRIVIYISIAAFLFGAYYINYQKQLIEKNLPQDEKNIILSGEIYQYEEKENSYAVYLKNCVYTNDLKLSQPLKLNKNILKCIVYVKDKSDFKIGDVITVKGRVNLFKSPANFGQFNEKTHYFGLGIYFQMFADEIKQYYENENFKKQIFKNAKDYLHNRLLLTADEKTAGIYQAMLLGEKGSVDENIKELYNKGTIGHVLVVSGLHFSIAGIAVFTLLRKRFGYVFSGISSCILLFCFGILTGFAASAVRAFVMFFILMCGQMWGRDYDCATSLGAAVIIILLKNPFTIALSGFVLSVSAVCGIIVMVPVIEKMFPCKSKIIKGILSSLAIQIFTLPVNLYYFYSFNPYSALINAVVLIFISFVLICGAIAALISLISIKAAAIVIIPGKIILLAVEFFCENASKLPFFTIYPGKPSFKVCVIYYCILFFLTALFYRSKKINNGYKKRFLPVFICLCVIFFIHRNYKLEITMLDVGQGQCIYIKTADGYKFLYDAGSTDVSKVGKYRVIPFLEAKAAVELDAVFVSHLDEDHVNGVFEMIYNENIKIRQLFLPDTTFIDENYIKLLNLAADKKIDVKTFGKSDVLRAGDAEFVGLHPYKEFETDNKNDTSIIMNLCCDNFNMLFCGDMEEDAMKSVLKNKKLWDVDILQVAHHGSSYTTSEEFLNKVKPQISLISCGKNNRYGHPHKDLIDRLVKHSSNYYITKDFGAVTVRFNNGKLYLYHCKT